MAKALLANGADKEMKNMVRPAQRSPKRSPVAAQRIAVGGAVAGRNRRRGQSACVGRLLTVRDREAGGWCCSYVWRRNSMHRLLHARVGHARYHPLASLRTVQYRSWPAAGHPRWHAVGARTAHGVAVWACGGSSNRFCHLINQRT